MGRGNIRTTGPYEGLFYIDNGDWQVYRNVRTDETRLLRDLTCSEITDWQYDETESQIEHDNLLEEFAMDFMRKCPSFEPVVDGDKLWLHGKLALMENDLFYVCIGDNEWSLSVELIQKEDYSDCRNAWISGMQRTHYQKYLNSMKTALLDVLPCIYAYAGPWTSEKIERKATSC